MDHTPIENLHKNDCREYSSITLHCACSRTIKQPRIIATTMPALLKGKHSEGTEFRLQTVSGGHLHNAQKIRT